MTGKLTVLPVFMLCTLCPVVGSLPKFLQIFGRQSRNQGLHSPDVSRIQRYMIDRSNLPISTAERSEPRDIIRQSEPFSTDIELPWQCGTEYYWRDLGEMHFPRHIKEVRCLNATCWYGHYRCTPAKYTAMVLTRSVGGDEDGNVPYSLRQEWRFEHLDITIGCMCSR